MTGATKLCGNLWGLSAISTPPKTRRGQKRLSPLSGTVEDKHAKFSKPTEYAPNPCASATVVPSKFERASSALRPGLPKGALLPCRDVECAKISSHLSKGVVQGGSSKVLYISGMPGTGKTAMVLEVLEKMQSSHLPFHLVHINAMRLSTPAQVFRDIADQLPFSPVSNNEARHHVTQYFRDLRPIDRVVVLLIDEIDCLKTDNQAILYKVFDWLEIPNARLVLVAISNTMNLTEHFLPRVASRFDIERVDFEPYTRDQIYEILCTRLRTVDALQAFGDIVLRFCAARVANASGDVRKALQVCQRAIQLCMEEPSLDPSPVKLAHFHVAEKELLFANPAIQAVMKLSTQTRLFLAAMVLELRSKEDEQAVMLHAVSTRFQKLAAMMSVDRERAGVEVTSSITDSKSEEMAQQFIQRLEAMSIVAKPSGSQVASPEFQKILLGALDVDELATALLQEEGDPTIREALEAGSPDLLPGRVFKDLMPGKVFKTID